MLNSFSPKDIESLSKLASILIIPFMSAALFVDFGLWIVSRSRELNWLINFEVPVVTVIAKIVAFVMSVIIVAFTLELVRGFLYQYPKVTLLAGFNFLAFGVLVLGYVVQGGEQYILNPFWHLAFLVWGLEIFSPSKP